MATTPPVSEDAKISTATAKQCGSTSIDARKALLAADQLESCPGGSPSSPKSRVGSGNNLRPTATASGPEFSRTPRIAQVLEANGVTVNYEPSENGTLMTISRRQRQGSEPTHWLLSADMALRVSMACSVFLLGVKVVCLVISGSLAVMATMVDSLLDLLSQIVLLWTEQSAAKSLSAEYPAGRRRLEPLGVVVCACMMGMASIEVIRESVTTLTEYVDSSTYPPLEVTPLVFFSMILGIVMNALNWLYCARVSQVSRSESLKALSQDCLNDVLSIAFAVAAALLSWISQASFWWADPVGAIVISVYIVVTWLATAKEQTDMIAGRSAEADFIQDVRNLVNDHHPEMYADIIRAYHFGPNYLVEVECVLPPDTLLKESHDVGMDLQHKIEALESVERAFVHIDYKEREYDEHDEESWPNEYYERVRGESRTNNHSPKVNATNSHPSLRLAAFDSPTRVEAQLYR